jgi:hypothetical protein
MNYFTPELMKQLDSPDPAVANAADAEWDRRQEEYERKLQRLEPDLPEHIRTFNGLLLHDARVVSIAREGDRLLLVLHKDIPPHDLVILTYRLVSDPVIDREALPIGERSPVMDYLYNEFDLVRTDGETYYTESILFSNGWEIRLRFHDVQVTRADPIFAPSMAQSA